MSKPSDKLNEEELDYIGGPLYNADGSPRYLTELERIMGELMIGGQANVGMFKVEFSRGGE